MSPRRRDTLLEAVKAGLAIPAEKHPEIIRQKFHRPSEAEFRRFRELEKIRDAHAHNSALTRRSSPARRRSATWRAIGTSTRPN
jgi:hypothetical protein